MSLPRRERLSKHTTGRRNEPRWSRGWPSIRLTATISSAPRSGTAGTTAAQADWRPHTTTTAAARGAAWCPCRSRTRRRRGLERTVDREQRQHESPLTHRQSRSRRTAPSESYDQFDAATTNRGEPTVLYIQKSTGAGNSSTPPTFGPRTAVSSEFNGLAEPFGVGTSSGTTRDSWRTAAASSPSTSSPPATTAPRSLTKNAGGRASSPAPGW